MTAPPPPTPAAHREFRKTLRQALLLAVDALERLDSLDRTAELRREVRRLRARVAELEQVCYNAGAPGA